MILRDFIIIMSLILVGCEQPQPVVRDNLTTSASGVSTQSNGLIDHVITSMAGGAAAGAAGGAAHAAVSHGIQRWQAKRRLNRMQNFRASRR
jgi:hypothetical protein